MCMLCDAGETTEDGHKPVILAFDADGQVTLVYGPAPIEDLAELGDLLQAEGFTEKLHEQVAAAKRARKALEN